MSKHIVWPNRCIKKVSVPLITSCLFFSLEDKDLSTFSSTPFVQSGGSGSASVSESPRTGSVLFGVSVTVTASWTLCCAAVTISSGALGLSRLLKGWKRTLVSTWTIRKLTGEFIYLADKLELEELPEFVVYDKPWVSRSTSLKT